MIYLDNSATTALSQSVKEKMISVLDAYGNPSSRHALGIESRKLIEEARENIAVSLGLKKSDSQRIIFTSCGTEANNLAVFGSIYSKEKYKGKKIITTNSEHPSIENAMQRLQKDGFEVVRLSTVGGVLDIDEFERQMDGNVVLVSIMTVNNETGAVYDIKKIFSIAKKKNPDVITHTDCVQGYLKIAFNPQDVGADLVSISSHKIHGPKGVGALYVSPEIMKTKKLVPFVTGGGQESGFRSGTENLIGIVGFGVASKEGYANQVQNIQKLLGLRTLVQEQAISAGAKINTPHGEIAPHIVSVRLPNIKSETMLNFLSAKGICVSSGSACSSHSGHISGTLIGFGLTANEADSTIRVSLCENNTEEDVITFGKALKDGIGMLVKFKR